MSPNLNESLVTLNPAHEDADGSDAAHEHPSDDDPSNAAASRAYHERVKRDESGAALPTAGG